MKSKLDQINESFIRDGASKITDEDLSEVIAKEKEVKGKLTGALEKFVGEVRLFFMLIKDYFSGDYRQIPWWCISAIVFALLYVLNPLDIIPDFIPILGQIDDAAVVFLCWRMIGNDLQKYRRWKDGKAQIIEATIED